MDKYGTYEIFENRNTGEVIEMPLHAKNELAKLASNKDWKRVEEPKRNGNNGSV